MTKFCWLEVLFATDTLVSQLSDVELRFVLGREMLGGSRHSFRVVLDKRPLIEPDSSLNPITLTRM